MKKKTLQKRTLSVMLVVMMLFSILIAPSNSYAGTSVNPNLSRTAYAEMKADTAIPCYKNASCTQRGSSLQTSSYAAQIDPNDVFRIEKVTNSYSIVLYGTPRGKARAYVKTQTLFHTSAPVECVKSKAKTTVYFRRSTSSKVGEVFANDTVYRFGQIGEWTIILYSAKNSSGRIYKVGWVKTSTYNEVVKGNKPNPTKYTNLSDALYQNSNAFISCGFDGYRNTSGRHEGIDMQLKNGASIYSLTDGTITKISRGYRGSSGLSTLAVFYKAANKTVIYLHSEILSSLRVGQTLHKGDLIGYQDWRGCSTASGGHTHVEVRSGNRTSAAISVLRSSYKRGSSKWNQAMTLENDNPKSFWNNQGYTVK